MKKLFLIALIAISQLVYAQNNVIIQGTIKGKNFTSVQLVDGMNSNEISKADIQNNQFKITAQIPKEDIYVLLFDQNNYFFLDLKPNDVIKYNIDFDDFNNSTVEGSDATALVLNTQKLLRTAKDEDQQSQMIDSVINANLNVYSSLLFAFNLDIDKYSQTHDKLRKSLINYNDRELYKEYDAQFKLAIGSVPPEIEEQTPDGKVVKLSSTRGQYVLVDFWASWCRPCRGESPNLVAAYDKYHDKGFTIYSVSLDEVKSDWTNAISGDKLGSWTHVSDLKGWYNIAAKAYGVSSIPSNFLLDPSGKIVAKNLRGEDLNKKLNQIFKN